MTQYMTKNPPGPPGASGRGGRVLDGVRGPPQGRAPPQAEEPATQLVPAPQPRRHPLRAAPADAGAVDSQGPCLPATGAWQGTGEEQDRMMMMQ